MQTDEKEKIIMEHVLGEKKKENLEMALDIISMTQKIRKDIIKSFLEKLKGFICKRLDMSQWNWKTELDYTSHGNISLSFGVSNQDEPISILLQSYGKVIYIGVFTDNSMNRLKNRLDNKFGPGKSEAPWWFWYQSLKSSNREDYADWTHKDTLIKMHTETDRVVKDIGNHLLEIIRVAEPEIEKWVQQNPLAP